jgi:uncharacterized protein YjiS (DUF1127 family)
MEKTTMQSLQTTLKPISRILAATILVAGSALVQAAAKYRDRRILERLSATELEDLGLCRAADGAIAFQPLCPQELEPDVAEVKTGYGGNVTAAEIEKAYFAALRG